MSGLDPNGRWGGRLVSRALPLDDTTIDALPSTARAELAEHWLVRAAAERRVGDAFVVVHRALVDSGANDAIVDLAHRAIDDEKRHAELCRAIASRFAGRELDALPPLELVVPRHEDATPALRRDLHILGHCALNETLASAVLEQAFAGATGPLAKAALRELLADEVDHARIGWGHLATRDRSALAAIAPWLLDLLRANVRMWRDADRVYPSDGALVEHGALTRPLLEDALRAALRDLILPGLAQLGLVTAEIERWAEAGAPD